MTPQEFYDEYINHQEFVFKVGGHCDYIRGVRIDYILPLHQRHHIFPGRTAECNQFFKDRKNKPPKKQDYLLRKPIHSFTYKYASWDEEE